MIGKAQQAPAATPTQVSDAAIRSIASNRTHPYSVRRIDWKGEEIGVDITSMTIFLRNAVELPEESIVNSDA